MINKKRKVAAALAVSVLCVSTLLPIQGPIEAKAKVKLSKTKISIKVGQSKTLKLKNYKKKIKWIVKTGKKLIKVKKSGKFSIKITGKKAGTAKVTCKAGKTKLTCKVTVKSKSNSNANASKDSTNAPKAVVTEKPMPSTATPAMTDVTPETVSATPEATASQKPKLRDYKLEEDEETISPEFIKQASSFAGQLAKLSMSEDVKNGKNTLVSPASILTAMTMAANGAANGTLDEMKNSLCGDMTLEDFTRELATSNRNIRNSANLAFSSANSLWLKSGSGWNFTDNYLNSSKTAFDAESFTEPFDSSTVDKVNNWIKDKTNGMIPRTLDQFDDNEVLCLVNALAFEGEWAKIYEEEMGQILKNSTFKNSLGNNEECTMLKCSERTKYISGQLFTGFTKKYKGGKYDFMAILPKEGVTPATFIESIENDELTKIYNGGENAIVVSEIPEFKYDYSSDVKGALRTMGFNKMFSATDSDFSNLATCANPSINLFFSRVLHKTHIEVDQYGTKAAAVTVMPAMPGSAAQVQERKTYNVKLDRPFVYAIVQSSTGIPVFVGAVNSVKE